MKSTRDIPVTAFPVVIQAQGKDAQGFAIFMAQPPPPGDHSGLPGEEEAPGAEVTCAVRQVTESEVQREFRSSANLRERAFYVALFGLTAEEKGRKHESEETAATALGSSRLFQEFTARWEQALQEAGSGRQTKLEWRDLALGRLYAAAQLLLIRATAEPGGQLSPHPLPSDLPQAIAVFASRELVDAQLVIWCDVRTIVPALFFRDYRSALSAVSVLGLLAGGRACLRCGTPLQRPSWRRPSRRRLYCNERCAAADRTARQRRKQTLAEKGAASAATKKKLQV